MTDTRIIDKILTDMNAVGMTQRDLARALDVSDARVSLMLRPTRNMRPNTIKRVQTAVKDYSDNTHKNHDWKASALYHIGRLKAAKLRIKELEARIEKLEQKEGSRTRSTPSPLSHVRVA